MTAFIDQEKREDAETSENSPTLLCCMFSLFLLLYEPPVDGMPLEPQSRFRFFYRSARQSHAD
jgi:hypothetical protein